MSSINFSLCVTPSEKKCGVANVFLVNYLPVKNNR